MALDPDILVYLTSARTEFEGRAMVASLEAEGIPGSVFSAAARMAQWEIGYTDPIKVMVRRVDHARAVEVLGRARVEARQIDWSQVDVNEPGVLADGAMCETCGLSVAGLPGDTRACPNCEAALFPADGELPAPSMEHGRVPFAVRWGRMRRIGTLLIMVAMVLPIVNPSMAIPLVGIGLILIAFGGKNRTLVRPAVPRS